MAPPCIKLNRITTLTTVEVKEKYDVDQNSRFRLHKTPSVLIMLLSLLMLSVVLLFKPGDVLLFVTLTNISFLRPTIPIQQVFIKDFIFLPLLGDIFVISEGLDHLEATKKNFNLLRGVEHTSTPA